MKIFVSYTLRDAIIKSADLKKIETILQNDDVFIHLFNPDVDSQDKIRTKILESNLIILIKSDKTFFSKWVLIELQIAHHSNIPIFMISIEDLRNH